MGETPHAKIPIANPAVLSRDSLEEGKIMVNCDTGAAITVNQTGALVWSLINGRRTIEEIAEAVRQTYGNAPETVRDDVAALLSTLAEDGFIGYEI